MACLLTFKLQSIW